MTNKKENSVNPIAKESATESSVKKHSTTQDIFSLSSPNAKVEAKKVEAKPVAKVEAKKVDEKKAEVKKEAKVASKPEAKKVEKNVAKKVEKHVASKSAKADTKVATKEVESKVVSKAKKEVNNAVSSLFDVASDIMNNMWDFSRDVNKQRFDDLSKAFENVEKVIAKADAVIEESNKNKKAIKSSSDVINKKSQELNDEIVTFCEQVFDNHMKNANMLLACRDLQDLQNVRNEIYERDIARMFDRANRSADIWFGMLENSYEPLQKRADEIAEKLIFRIL